MSSDTGYGPCRRFVVGSRVEGTSRVGHDPVVFPYTVSVVHMNPEMSCLPPALRFLFLGIRVDYELPLSVTTEGVYFSDLSVPFPARLQGTLSPVGCLWLVSRVTSMITL